MNTGRSTFPALAEPMGRSTEFLLAPTIDECIQAGDKIGLPRLEAMKFHAHHESKGWMIGKLRMKSLVGALQTWRLNWLERTGRIDTNGHEHEPAEKKLNGAEIVVKGRELERVLQRMEALTRSVEGLGSMRPDDREEYRKLKTRRDELKRILGVMI